MQETPGKGPALGRPAAHLCLWLTTGLGLAGDLASKSLAWHGLGPPPDPFHQGDPYVLIPGWLQLGTSQNLGIVFGLNFGEMLGLGAAGGRIATALLTIATCGLIFYLFATSRARQRWLHVACGLVLAGALGNLYDRLVFGYVRDFIQFVGSVEVAGRELGWPYVFNLADVYLVVGVVTVAIVSIFAPSAATDRGAPKQKAERSRG